MGDPTEIRPFRIDIPQADLDDLHRRLAGTRWPDQPPGVGWTRGVPLGYLKELAADWADGFDWRKQEARLKQLSQFVTSIHGQRIHFVHLRSPEPSALPLLVIHGWPSSPVEFLKALDPIAGVAEPAHQLPEGGGDPEQVAPARLGDRGREPIAGQRRDHQVEPVAGVAAGGRRVGQGCDDHDWTDPAVELPDDAVDRDQLLTGVSVFWCTGAGASSAHATYEGVQAWREAAARPAQEPGAHDDQPPGPPTGVAVFAADTTIRGLLDPAGAMHWSEFDRGGHFPAMETPDLLVGDLRAFFRPLRTKERL